MFKEKVLLLQHYGRALWFTNFFRLPTNGIVGSRIYNDSIKRLSFQYRIKNEDKLIAYIAVSQDNPNIDVPNVDNQLNGCRILAVHTEPYQVGHYQVTNVQLLDALLDEAEYYIRGWINNQNGQFQFDYLWFNIADFDSQEILERIDNMTQNNGVAYKLIERYEQPNQWLLIL